jgi:hypothetical protein
LPTYLFYPQRADGISLTFIAESAPDDASALLHAAEIAEAHDCVGVFVWEPDAVSGQDRFVGEALTSVTTPARVRKAAAMAVS